MLNLSGWAAHSCKDEEKGDKYGRCNVQCTEAQENRQGACEGQPSQITAEYAVRFSDGAFWSLVGGDLFQASIKAAERRAESGLGDRSKDVLAFVQAKPEGTTPKAVGEALGLTDARAYLKRLADKNKIEHRSRGVYAPIRAAAVGGAT